MILRFALILFSSLAARAAGPAATPPPAPQAIEYELLGLKPAGVSQYNAPLLAFRQYLHFWNDEGSHFFIYEESPNLPPLKDLVNLREAMGASGVTCEVTVSCTPKAFCTGDCRNMYYEFSNSPASATSPGSSSCQLKSFTCEREKPLPVPAAVPAPALPAVPKGAASP